LGNGDTFNVSDAVGLGNGAGTFTISYSGDDGGGTDSYASGEIPFVAAADFNGDGNLDFLVCNAGNASVLLGNGDGTFQTPIVSAGGCSAAALGDFHGNGFLDLATEAAVFTGNGTGEFPESGSLLTPTTILFGLTCSRVMRSFLLLASVSIPTLE
jgi:FG-GAP-like repeat